MYRDHDDKAWKNCPRRRKHLLGHTLHLILKEFQRAELPWQTHLAAEFAGYSRVDLEKAVQEWAWCSAPAELMAMGMEELRRRSSLSPTRFHLRLARKVGLRFTLKHLGRGSPASKS